MSTSDFEKKIDMLLEEICIKHGFCGCVKNEKPICFHDIVPHSGIISAEFFADLIFLADNMNPYEALNKWQKHKDNIRELFIEILGVEQLDAKFFTLGDID